jgi:hypothetical protein
VYDSGQGIMYAMLAILFVSDLITITTLANNGSDFSQPISQAAGVPVLQHSISWAHNQPRQV